MLKKFTYFMTILFCFFGLYATKECAKFHEYRFYTVPVGSRMVGGGRRGFIIRGFRLRALNRTYEQVKMVCNVNILNSVRQKSDNLCFVYAVSIYFRMCKVLVCFFLCCLSIT